MGWFISSEGFVHTTLFAHPNPLFKPILVDKTASYHKICQNRHIFLYFYKAFALAKKLYLNHQCPIRPHLQLTRFSLAKPRKRYIIKKIYSPIYHAIIKIRNKKFQKNFWFRFICILKFRSIWNFYYAKIRNNYKPPFGHKKRKRKWKIYW